MSNGYQHGKYDILVTCAPVKDALPGDSVMLRMEELKLIISANHPFANRHWNQQALPRETIKEELSNVDAIRHERGATNHDIENELFHGLGMQTQTICRLGNYGALMQMVGGGMGYSIVSGDVVDKDERVKCWSLSPKLERLNMLFIHPNVNMGSPEKYLIELIKNYKLFK